MLDHFTISSLHIGGIAGLDHFTPQNGLGQLARNYLISCKVEGKSEKTIALYSLVLRGFLGLGDELSTAQVRMFLLSLQERGLRPSSVHNHYKCLRAFFNWLVNEGAIPENPMHNIKPPKVPRLIIKPFSRGDIDNLLLLCSGNRFLDLRNRAIILVFLDTGLRLAELTNIQLQDVNFEGELIKVMGKGAKERVVRIGKTAQRALLKYLLSRKDSHSCLWVTEERRPMATSAIQIMVKRLCQRAGITNVKQGPHTFRHTFAINYLRNGGDTFTLQYILGHSDLGMTRRYVGILGLYEMVQAHKMASPVDNLRLK